MQQKKAAEEQIESESYKDYWTVDDMYTFENIGFSHQVGTTKYVINNKLPLTIITTWFPIFS